MRGEHLSENAGTTRNAIGTGYSSGALATDGHRRPAHRLVWAVDARFKWQPDFIINFTDYLT
jgi:hypothetical protein